jgi:methylmalonyl-CoA mutase cobalamin-binding subunit
LIKRALALGFRPSGVVPAELADLERLVTGPAEDRAAAGGLSEWLSAAERLDGNALERCLRRGWSSHGGRRFVLELALPFMQEVGHRWSRRDLVVVHEHFASELLRGFLAQQIRALSRLARGPRVVCAALSGEQHSLGLQMAAVLLTLADLEVVFLGADTPIDEIARASEDPVVEAVVIGSSGAAEISRVAPTIERLRARVAPAIQMVVGGISPAGEIPGVAWLDSLADLEPWAGALRSTAPEGRIVRSG